MSTTTRTHSSRSRAPWLAVPRRVWLATLGAAAVTRRWADNEAAPAFRSLVRQGEAIETLVLRDVETRVKSSVESARRIAGDAQRSTEKSLRRLARSASTLQSLAGSTETRAKKAATRTAKRTAPRKTTRTAKVRGRRTTRRARA